MRNSADPDQLASSELLEFLPIVKKKSYQEIY